MTMYVVPLCLKVQYTFGTGTEVFRATNFIVLASANVVDCDALIHIFDIKSIGPDQESECQKKPHRIILCATMVRSRYQSVALIGLDSMPIVFELP